LVHEKMVYTMVKNSGFSSLWCFDGNKWNVLKDRIIFDPDPDPDDI